MAIPIMSKAEERRGPMADGDGGTGVPPPSPPRPIRDPVVAGDSGYPPHPNAKEGHEAGERDASNTVLNGEEEGTSSSAAGADDKKHSVDDNDGNRGKGNGRSNKRRKRNNDRNNKRKKANAKFNRDPPATVEDLSAMDAATYLAWVNQQAEAMPNVFVAKPEDRGEGKNDNSAESKPAASVKAAEQEDKEEPFQGSNAMIQIMISKRMDILPPPTKRHLPFAAASSTIPSSAPCDDDDDDKEAKGNKGGDDDDVATTTTSATTHQWVQSTVANFSRLRAYLEQQSAIRKKQSKSTPERKVAVPRMKDRAAWHVFCLGKEEAYGNAGGRYEGLSDGEEEEVGAMAVAAAAANDSNGNGNSLNGGATGNCSKSGDGSAENGLVDDGANPLIHDTKKLPAAANDTESTPFPPAQPQKPTFDPSSVPPNGHAPAAALLLQLDQVLTRRLFHHHAHYLVEWKFPLTDRRAEWLYGLLARMEKPWHREECCAARGLLREFCLRRWELELPAASASATDSEDASTKNVNPSADRKVEAISANSNNGTSKEEDSKAWDQLALLNTLIAITGIYYEQGAVAGGDGMDSLFTVAAAANNGKEE